MVSTLWKKIRNTSDRKNFVVLKSHDCNDISGTPAALYLPPLRTNKTIQFYITACGVSATRTIYIVLPVEISTSSCLPFTAVQFRYHQSKVGHSH